LGAATAIGFAGPAMIAAREIGPAKSKLIEVDVSRFERWKNDLFGSGDAQRPIVAPPAPAAPKT
jgi:hypothetical protein